jgi:hypothetical protein
MLNNGETLFSFFTFNQSEWLIYGGLVLPSTLEDDTTFLIYDPPGKYAAFPLAFGDNDSTSDSGFVRLEGGLVPSNNNIYEYVYDGFGTLILPNDTFQNVARVKLTWQANLGFIEFKDIRYWWISTTGRGVLMRFVESEVPPSITGSYLVGAGLASNLPPKKTATPDMRLYPNPARERVVLSGIPRSTRLHLDVHDLQGRLVRERWIDSPGTSAELDIAGLPTGLYWVSVKSDGYTQTIPLSVR